MLHKVFVIIFVYHTLSGCSLRVTKAGVADHECEC